MTSHAARRIEEPIFVWVEDAAYYFNQLGYAPEELMKSTLVVGSREGDVDNDGRPFPTSDQIFVSEERLGFWFIYIQQPRTETQQCYCQMDT